MVALRNTPIEDLIKLQLQSEAEFTDQYSSVNFKSLLQRICPKFKACSTNSGDKLPFVYSMKSLMFDLTTILLPKSVIFSCYFFTKVMHYQNLFTDPEFKLND